MSEPSFTCPYCNALMEPPQGPTERAVCPTCGETFTPLPSAAEAESHLGVPAPGPEPAPPGEGAGQVGRYLAPEEAVARPSRVLVLAVILGVMLLMAGAGLWLALETRDFRRANDKGIIKKPFRESPFLIEPTAPPPPAAAVAPARLAGLGYLPGDSNVVAAAHLGALRASPEGRRLLAQPIQVGPVRLRLEEAAGLAGLPAESVDHLVLGLVADSTTLPRIVLVLRTREPYRAGAVREALKAQPLFDAPPGEKKELYQVRWAGPGLTVVLWCADEHTLVFGFLPGDLGKVPVEPRAGVEHLPREVQDLLRERVPGGAALWTAIAVDSWDTMRKAPWFGWLEKRLAVEDVRRLTGIRACAAWVQLAAPTSAWAVLRCADAPRARDLADYLRGPDGQTGPDLTLSQDDAWLTLQRKASLDQITRALGP